MKYMLLLALAFTSLVGQTQSKKWKLVWGDEFDYHGLPDSTKWTGETGGHGWGNHELEYYTSGRRENARVGEGLLTIEARKEDWMENKYTSARLISKAKLDTGFISWRYGKIEVRAKLPKGRGTWPAIWMLGATKPLKWPDDGEIDIMEHVGFNQGFIHASVHCRKYYHSIGTQKTDTIVVADCSENFHVYSVEWNKNWVSIAVDGKAFFRFTNEHSGYAGWPFDNKMYLLLNVAVGGDWGAAKGVDETIWPQRMEIDYVRVYQRK